jgi:hypothetical protein
MCTPTHVPQPECVNPTFINPNFIDLKSQAMGP